MRKKSFLKKAVANMLALVMVLSISMQTFAAENQNLHIAATTNEFSVEDVKSLEPYVSVENGYLMLDTETAESDGVDSELLTIQQNAFNILNERVNDKTITINDDLSIDRRISSPYSLYAAAGHAYNCGGGINTNTTEYWWGYARYACDCETNRMSADFYSAASVAAGVGVVGAYFGAVGAIPGGISAAYWSLLASRLDANNRGRGVYVEMTWVLAFDITPQ